MSIFITLSAGPEEDEALRGRKSFRGQPLVSQSPETELMLEGDDDAVSLLQEKEVDNLAGESTYTQYTVQSVWWRFSIQHTQVIWVSWRDTFLQSSGLKVLCAIWVWIKNVLDLICCYWNYKVIFNIPLGLPAQRSPARSTWSEMSA